MLRRILGNKGPRLKLAQSLGAFTRPDQGDISPLYVFLDVENEGRESIEIARIQISTKDGFPAHPEPLEGERSLPIMLEPGGSIRVWTRAKPMAQTLDRAGYVGKPRLCLVVEDGAGNLYEKRFAFRAEEYLRLKDE